LHSQTTLNKTSSKALIGFKYIYLVVFFALLAGLFHPLITDTSFDGVMIGVLTLFVGLAGGVLLHRSTQFEKKRGIFEGTGGILAYRSIISVTSDKKRMMFLAGGFTLIIISLFFIIQLTGRV